MRYPIAIVFSLASSLLAQAPVQGQGKGFKTAPGWLSSLQEGRAQAKQSGKPMMVVLRCVP